MKIRVGRPTLYRGDIHPAFAAHLAQEGKTEDEIAERLGVNRSTLVEWKNKYPEFSNAMKSNKEEADSVVEQSLYRKAVQGDVIACRYWLSNRQPAKWREKQEVEQSGTVRVEGKIEVLSLEDVTKKYADAIGGEK
jgi:transcriptional regulator with XRE-family HTH domain